jgi:microcystin-dependent protein
MSDPFIGQIMMFGGNFAPRNWALCDGQLLSISQNQALFSILGTTYGGDGRTTFGLPGLRGRVPVHAGTGAGLATLRLGQRGGNSNTTLTAANLPGALTGCTTAVGNTSNPTGNIAATVEDSDRNGLNMYSTGTPTGSMRSPSIATAQAISNMQPFLAVNYIIALQGLFPSRN